MMRIFGNVNKEQSYTNPEDAPYDGHHPSRTCEPVKYSIFESDFVKQATSEWAETHSESLTHHKKASERRSSTNTDNSSVGTITFAVHQHCEPKAVEDTADEDEVEEIGLAATAVENVSDDGSCTACIEREGVSS